MTNSNSQRSADTTVEELKAACLNAANLLFPDLHAVGIGRQNWEVDGTRISQPVLVLPSGQVQKINIEVKINGPEMPDWNFFSHVLHLLSEELKPSALPHSDFALGQATQKAARDLLEDGVQMGEVRTILNSHLHKVRAAILTNGKQWILWRNVGVQDDHVKYDTFAQAFEAALTLLENRAGHGAVVVTPSDDIAKELRG